MKSLVLFTGSQVKCKENLKELKWHSLLDLFFVTFCNYHLRVKFCQSSVSLIIGFV